MNQEAYVKIYRHPFDWSVKVNDIADEIVDDELLMGYNWSDKRNQENVAT